MSQEKVDRYKKEKANRKKIIKKQKIKGFFSKIAVAVVALAIVGYLGFSTYRYYNPVETTTTFTNAYSVEELSSILEEEGLVETDTVSDDEDSEDTDSEESADDTDSEESADDTDEDSETDADSSSDTDDTEESGEDTTTAE